MTSPRYVAETLADLPAPAFVEVLSWQTISGQMQSEIQALSGNAYYWLPSDPAVKALDIAADHEVKVRQRINEVGLAGMIAHARASDLDHLGATFYNTRRLIVDDTDPKNIITETDTAYRRRIELSMEAQNTAGAEGSYEYHALSSSGLVKDARAYSPAPADAVLYILSQEDSSGIPSPALLQAVETYVSAKLLRPAGDRLTVQAAEIVRYSLTATFYFYHGTVQSAALAAAEAGFTAYRTKAEHIGHGATESGVHQALHQPGVYRVDLQPTINGIAVNWPIADGEFQVAICDSHTFSVGGVAQ